MATGLSSAVGNAAARATSLGNLWDQQLSNRTRLGFNRNLWDQSNLQQTPEQLAAGAIHEPTRRGQRMNFVNRFNREGGLEAAGKNLQSNFFTEAFDDVSDIYKTALGRKGDETGIDYWIKQLVENESYNADNWKTELARQFGGSAEGRGRQAIDNAYNTFKGQGGNFNLDDLSMERYRDYFVGPGNASGTEDPNYLTWTAPDAFGGGSYTGASGFTDFLNQYLPATTTGGTNDTLTGGNTNDTLTGGNTNDTLTGGATEQDIPLDLIADWTSGIGGLYNSILGRDADTAGLNYWLDQLRGNDLFNTGATDWQRWVGDMMKAEPEYIRREDLKGLYNNAGTDPGGLEAFLDQYVGQDGDWLGGGREAAVNYLSTLGGTTGPEPGPATIGNTGATEQEIKDFMTSSYRSLFDRSPVFNNDPTNTADYWINELKNNIHGEPNNWKSWLNRGFRDSQEFKDLYGIGNNGSNNEASEYLTSGDLDAWWSGLDKSAFTGSQNTSGGMDEFMKFMMFMQMMQPQGGMGHGGSQYGYGGLNPGGVQAAYNPMSNLQEYMSAFRSLPGMGSPSTSTININ
tara:strand:+ start:194 stop:1909 length:1716 start_codon:yes stop_codon:yes gene_type:complete